MIPQPFIETHRLGHIGLGRHRSGLHNRSRDGSREGSLCEAPGAIERIAALRAECSNHPGPSHSWLFPLSTTWLSV